MRISKPYLSFYPYFFHYPPRTKLSSYSINKYSSITSSSSSIELYFELYIVTKS